jgi:hypothetical protein
MRGPHTVELDYDFVFIETNLCVFYAVSCDVHTTDMGAGIESTGVCSRPHEQQAGSGT